MHTLLTLFCFADHVFLCFFRTQNILIVLNVVTIWYSKVVYYDHRRTYPLVQDGRCHLLEGGALYSSAASPQSVIIRNGF